MSLNGLDAAAVKEAYEAAVAEPGGWYVMCNFSSYTGRIPHPAHAQCYAILCTQLAESPYTCHVELCKPIADPANCARLQVPAQVHQSR